MKPTVITTACIVLAVLSVVFDRLVLPALLMLFNRIEQSFAPVEPEPLLVLASGGAVPVSQTSSVVTPITKATPKKRTTRKRAPAKSKTSATAEA